MFTFKNAVAIFLTTMIFGGLSNSPAHAGRASSVNPHQAVRLLCFRNAMKDGHAAAVQVRACNKDSSHCSGWYKVSIPHGATEGGQEAGQWDYLKRVYFEYNVQGGGATGFRGKDAGGRRKLPLTRSSCSGITVYICGNKKRPFGTNATAASTDSSCR